MKHSEAIRLIDSTFSRLDQVCGSSSDWERYLALIDQEEKGHRRFCPEGVKCGLTFGQSRRLFAVKEIFDRWVPRQSERIFTPEAKDYFSIRGSVFGACAIAHQRGDEILKEFPIPFMADWLNKIDYVELNKDQRQLQAA